MTPSRANLSTFGVRIFDHGNRHRSSQDRQPITTRYAVFWLFQSQLPNKNLQEKKQSLRAPGSWQTNTEFTGVEYFYRLKFVACHAMPCKCSMLLSPVFQGDFCFFSFKLIKRAFVKDFKNVNYLILPFNTSSFYE